MKTFALLLALLCAGCASGQYNRDYAHTNAPATDYGLPNSPHSF